MIVELHQLKTFYHVATCLNFSKAAELVSLSQPAVSRQIESLEKYFELSLFNRSGKKIELTEAGRRLLQYTDQLLNLAEQTEKAMAALKNIEAGELKIGAGTTIGNYILPPIILEFNLKYPHIKTELFIDKTVTITEMLLENEIDIAIIAKPLHIANVFNQPLMKDQIQLLVGKNHTVAKKTEVNSIHDFENETFILRPNGSNTRECVEKLFEKENFIPIRIQEFDTNEAVKLAIAEGYGVGFLSGSVCRIEMANEILHPVPLQGECNREFSIVHKKNQFMSPASLIFSSFLSKNIRN